MPVLKYEVIYFMSLVIYFLYFDCLQLRCTSAALLDHFDTSANVVSYVCGILIMKRSLISFYHRHDACLPATTKDPLRHNKPFISL